MKQYVGMGFNICPAHGNKHSEVVLLDKRLHKTLEPQNYLGLAFCPECAQKLDEGYVILVGAIDPGAGKEIDVHNAERTGEIIYVSREAASALLNLSPEKAATLTMAFIAPEVVAHLSTFATYPIEQETTLQSENPNEKQTDPQEQSPDGFPSAL